MTSSSSSSSSSTSEETDTPFVPYGGFPSIIRNVDESTDKKGLETRGFSTTNIVDIQNIMNTNKKTTMFLAFGPEDENAVHSDNSISVDLGKVFDENSQKFDGISFSGGVPPNIKPKNIRRR